MILAPGQPIPHGRPYRYHLNGPVYMMTARKRVGSLPTHRLAMRHSVDHSSSDSSSEASSDFHSDASFDSSSRHSLSDHSSPDLPSTFAGPSRKRRRSPMTSVPALPPVSGALSPVCADLIPSPKRIKSPETTTDLESCLEDSFEPYVPREVGLGVDVKDESSEQSRSRATDIEVDDDVERSDRMDIDSVEAVIEACFYFADIIRASGVDVRVEAMTVARDDVETGTRDPIVVSDNRDTPPVVPEVIPEPAQEGAVGSTYKTLGDLGHRIVGVESTVTSLTERVAELERDNRRLKDTASVETRRVAEEMEAREAARTLEPLNENGDEQEGEHGGNGNGGNRGNRNGGNGNGGNGENKNGNRNGNHGMNYGDNALTWWNSHKRKIGVDAAYAMNWAGLMRLMTEVYCPRNEIQKMETKLWNLTVKGNDLTAYTQRFHELILLCTRMVPDEEDIVERFIGGLPDNIHGNVITANPTRLQYAILVTNIREKDEKSSQNGQNRAQNGKA
ncbi:putative reverse transcriptase domain-containing protein [Tanacetum coccineum]|uniref:Reverse transcriptase domain-containing protein n=1 Tax=Tanacetum coccineum TaxID=301880 RepID=A0ABQ5E1V1_9ASTR